MPPATPAAEPLTVLHIGAQQTTVLSRNGTSTATPLLLDLGAQKTAQQFFRHAPPTPYELENAIAAVEDEVMRVQPQVARDSRLVTSDTVIRDLARLAGVAPAASMQLPIEAMEQVFQRLSALSLGRPASQDELPSDTAFAATLLILREFMHHLQFTSITIQA